MDVGPAREDAEAEAVVVAAAACGGRGGEVASRNLAAAADADAEAEASVATATACGGRRCGVCGGSDVAFRSADGLKPRDPSMASTDSSDGIAFGSIPKG